MKKRRGSALIIALLLISAVGAVAFGIARVMFVESASTAIYENGALAYYPAESGIEEGFLRYRYNMNAEVPFANWNLGKNADKIYRSDLSDNKMVTGITSVPEGDSNSQLISNNAKLFYDLRMGYLGTMVGVNPANYSAVYSNRSGDINADKKIDTTDIEGANFAAGDYDFLKISRDNSSKFDLSNYGFSGPQSEIKFGLNFRTAGAGAGGVLTTTEKCKAMAEITLTFTNDSTIAGSIHQVKNLINFDPNSCTGSPSISPDLFLKAPDLTNIYASGTGSGAYIQYNNLINDMLNLAGYTAPVGINKKVEISVKPLYDDVEINFGNYTCGLNFTNDDNTGICKDNRKAMVTGPYTMISSIGYYGGVSKKLVANIDRQSGTLYDLFDYVIYSAN